MSSYSRRRNIGNMSEISGIITNAIERGWSTEEITKSLINAGYSQEEISLEFKKNPTDNPQHYPLPNAPVFNSQNLSNYQTPSIINLKSKKTIWILVLLLIFCGIIGAFLLFW